MTNTIYRCEGTLIYEMNLEVTAVVEKNEVELLVPVAKKKEL